MSKPNTAPLASLLNPEQAQQLSAEQQQLINQYIQQGMTPEQAQLAAETGQIPESYMQEQLADPYTVQEQVQTSLEAPSGKPDEVDERQIHEILMGDAFDKALKNEQSKRAEGSAAIATEAAMKDNGVEQARKAVEAGLDTASAHEVEKNAIKYGLKKNMETKVADQVAEAAANGDSPIAAVAKGASEKPQAVDGRDSGVVERAAFDDRNDGAGEKILGKMAAKLEHRLHALGIKGTESKLDHRETIKNELAETTQNAHTAGGASELDLPDARQAERSENQVFGENFLESLEDPSRRFTRQGYTNVVQGLRGNPRALRAVVSALQAKHSGGLNEKAEEAVGRAVTDAHLDKAA